MGDGKTSPFGAGNGKGAPASGGKFDANTGTIAGGGGGKAAPFDQFAQKNPQKAMEAVRAPELTGASGEPSGGLTPFSDVEKGNAVNPERARERGVGSIGNAQSPFRLNGGSK